MTTRIRNIRPALPQSAPHGRLRYVPGGEECLVAFGFLDGYFQNDRLTFLYQ